MNRRKFLVILATSLGGLFVSGATYRIFRPSDPLDPFRKSTKNVLTARFGKSRADEMMNNIKAMYASIAPSVPDIGGNQSMCTEWLDSGVYYLAVYRVLKQAGYSIDQIGEIIYRTYETMADYPKWLLNLIGRLKYGKSYMSRLKAAAAESQSRRYPASWVFTFVKGDGREFDYGLDFTECGICKFYASHQALELAPYICLSDFVINQAFNKGLVRYHTIAEGSDRCDFRFKAGSKTFVYPLRNGWPPQFLKK